MVVGIKDIAAATDVSLATVSKALRGCHDVAPATRDRILGAAEEMRYRPNLLVRGMQTGRTQTIGVMMPIGGGSFFTRILLGIHDELSMHDYVPLLLSANEAQRTDGSVKHELLQIHRLVDRRVDGIILVPIEDSADDDYLAEIRDRNLPVVTIDRELPNAHLADFVGTDDHLAGQLAAEHLLLLGHKRIGHIAGPGYTSTARLRRKGFADAMQAAEVDFRIVEEQDFTNCRAASKSLLLDFRPTAVFCANDHLARNLCMMASRLGLKVGAELAVVGVGDLDLSGSISPSLTTLRQAPDALGKRAARQILSRINKRSQEGAQRILLPPQLIIRASTVPNLNMQES